MQIELTPEQKRAHAEMRAFVDAEISPFADEYDHEERIPRTLFEKLAWQGYLGAILPASHGGMGMDMITHGLLHQEVGRAASAVRNILGVQAMVAWPLLRWGNRQQKAQWLPQIAAGNTLAAFALTEPEVGSDAQHVATSATPTDGGYLLNGRKQWITGGQIADLFLIFVQCAGEPAAFLVDRAGPGLTIVPIGGMLGDRAAMLAEIHLEDCYVPHERLIGKVGSGFHIATTGLDLGRYSTAWGSVGIGQACLDASLDYTRRRKQFGVYLKEHQLIQRMITDMLTQVEAARLLCYQAGYLRAAGEPGAIMATMMAKYFASTMATRVASDAVQIHGASGCNSAQAVQRYLRDSRIMEIIEGTTQIHQVTIAQLGYQEYERQVRV